MTSRRSFLLTSGAALALAPRLVRRAGAAPAIPALELIEPLGEPSVIWTAFSYLQPVLQGLLGCPVTTTTVLGGASMNAAHAAMAPSSDPIRLFGGPLMSMQYAARSPAYDVDIEALTPIAKLSDGFSIAFFAKAGGALANWEDAAASAAAAPLKVSCLQEATAAYVALLMAQAKAGLAMKTTLRDTLGEVIDDVVSGRVDAGFVPTELVARDREGLTALATFGAQRNEVLVSTPTFAEITGDPKLAFTESLGAFGAPDMDPQVAAVLSEAFVQAGQDPAVMGTRETALFPVVVHGPDVLTETLERDNRVLDTILA